MPNCALERSGCSRCSHPAVEREPQPATTRGGGLAAGRKTWWSFPRGLPRRRRRARLLGRIRGLSSAQGAFKPHPEEWSIAETVEHLVLAKQGAVNRVWAASGGLRRGQPVWVGQPIHRGKSMERNEALAAGDVATKDRIVRVRGRRYRYQEVSPAEVIRLLENPRGSIPVHRVIPVPDGESLTDLIAVFLGGK